MLSTKCGEVNGRETDIPSIAEAFRVVLPKLLMGRYAVAKIFPELRCGGYTYDDAGKWYLYRAGLLHPQVCRRLPTDPDPVEDIHAWPGRWSMMVSLGPLSAETRNGTVYGGDSIKYSSFGPGNPYPHPITSMVGLNQPYFRSPWRYNGGIRGRANLTNVNMDAITNKQDSIAFIEKMIVKEAGLELAFEGHRWTDLIRVAQRLQKLNGTGGQFLQERMRRKYELSGLPVPDFSSEAKRYFLAISIKY